MKYEWHKAKDWGAIEPIVQAHGVCFNAFGNIMIIRGDYFY
jgi:hypothetical protein